MADFIRGTWSTALSQRTRYLKAIQLLHSQKIRWIFGDGTEQNEVYIISVDGVHCRINEPRHDPSSKWYSQKFNKAGLTYEVAVAIFHDKIVWFNGPFPASYNDWKIFTMEDGLIYMIPQGKLAVADNGYAFDETKVSTYNQFDGDDVCQFKQRVKARQESLNSRIKAFKVMSEDYKVKGDARLEKHETAFVSILVVIQYDMDNGKGLFKV